VRSNSNLSISDICEELGLQPQFLLELSQVASTLYTTYDIAKRSGGLRTICVPKDRLKRVQRLILDAFLSKIEMPSHVHGCVKGRSIVTNAREHVNKPLVINIDLANFFGSISYDMVLNIFKTHFHCDDESADVFTRLTTYGNFIPQGAPTSPAIANISALQLDQEIIQICSTNQSDHQSNYTRYVDDITISGGRELALLLADFYRAIHRHGFRANPQKLKFAGPSARQKVTGIVVNERATAPKKIIRKIRQQLYYCNKYTLEGHCERIGIFPTAFVNQLKGTIGYVRMSRPEVADEFDIILRQICKKSEEAGYTEEERKILLLRDVIEREAITTFVYENSSRRAAPARLFIDGQRVMVLRAFQLSPEEGWRTYQLSAMSSVAMEGHQS
jgi:RNA-directed DNA polymerase